MEQNLRKCFCFSDNCIEIFSCKFSQPWTWYLPSDVNVFKNTPKISPNTRGDILQINFRDNDEKHDQNGLMEILQAFGTLSHVDFQSLFWNGAL